MKNKISGVIADIIEKANLGDRKVKNGVTFEYKMTKSGGKDWRRVKSGTGGKDEGEEKPDKKDEEHVDTKSAKLKSHLASTKSDKLKDFAKNEKNDPKLRKMAHQELKHRGEDVSDIDLTTGKAGEEKNMFGGGEEKKDKKVSEGNEEENGKADVSEEGGDSDEDDYKNPDFIKKKFGDLNKSKKVRIAADKYIDKMKRKEPDYEPPEKVIQNMNKNYLHFLKTDSPLMIVSGDAGVGKTYNFHKVAEFAGKKPYDTSEAEEAEEGAKEGDYDYYESAEIKSLPQLMRVLYDHRDKTILLDDSDLIWKDPDMLGVIKKATASSGKRIIGNNSQGKQNEDIPKSFEFTGKIVVLTNKTAADFTKNEHLSAVYSRAMKSDINMTKSEKLEMIGKLKDKMDFTGVPRLKDKEKDKEERDEVFKMIKDNIDEIDPRTFTSRSFKEALEIKRGIEGANEEVKNNEGAKGLFGEEEDWKQKVLKHIVKAEGEEFISALEVLDLLSKEEKELKKALDVLDLG